MGFRFQRRVRISPGNYLNFSKSGISSTVRVGPFSFNSRGIVTAGAHGTGLSYRVDLNAERRKLERQQKREEKLEQEWKREQERERVRARVRQYEQELRQKKVLEQLKENWDEKHEKSQNLLGIRDELIRYLESGAFLHDFDQIQLLDRILNSESAAEAQKSAARRLQDAASIVNYLLGAGSATELQSRVNDIIAALDSVYSWERAHEQSD